MYSIKLSTLAEDDCFIVLQILNTVTLQLLDKNSAAECKTSKFKLEDYKKKYAWVWLEIRDTTRRP